MLANNTQHTATQQHSTQHTAYSMNVTSLFSILPPRPFGMTHSCLDQSGEHCRRKKKQERRKKKEESWHPGIQACRRSGVHCKLRCQVSTYISQCKWASLTLNLMTINTTINTTWIRLSQCDSHNTTLTMRLSHLLETLYSHRALPSDKRSLSLNLMTINTT